jgi:hypothetical protein
MPAGDAAAIRRADLSSGTLSFGTLTRLAQALLKLTLVRYRTFTKP